MTSVFGISKHNGRVYTQIIQNAPKLQIHPTTRQFVRCGRAVYTDK